MIVVALPLVIGLLVPVPVPVPVEAALRSSLAPQPPSIVFPRDSFMGRVTTADLLADKEPSKLAQKQESMTLADTFDAIISLVPIALFAVIAFTGFRALWNLFSSEF